MLLSALRADYQDDETVDNSLMEALVECYNNTIHWSTRRQILSIMSDKVPYSVLKVFLIFLDTGLMLPATMHYFMEEELPLLLQRAHVCMFHPRNLITYHEWPSDPRLAIWGKDIDVIKQYKDHSSKCCTDIDT